MSYVRTRLGRWFYEERGAPRRAGDPVVVLGHSFLCDGGMWRGQIGPLAELGRVVNIDGPGHGKSEIPPEFTLEEHAEAMMDVFSELHIDEAVLVGLSWGAMVAMRVALAHPHRIAGLALLDTSARKHSRADRIKYGALLKIATNVGLPRALVDAQVSTKMFAPKTCRERPDLLAAFARGVNGFERRGIARTGDAIMLYRTDISDRIKDIRTPTLVMCGREDSATKPEESELIAKRIPGARLTLLEDAGHLCALEKPDVVARNLVEFVRTLS